MIKGWEEGREKREEEKQEKSKKKEQDAKQIIKSTNTRAIFITVEIGQF